MGIASINPGTPHKKPQNMSITSTVTMLMEKDLPNIMGSTIDPNTTCTAVKRIMATNAVPGNCISISAKMEAKTVETTEPTIERN